MITRYGSITLPTDGNALGPYLRVKVAAGVLALAGADDDAIGTTENRALAGETKASVVPFFPPRYGVAGEAFAQYATLYRGANGKIVDTADGEPIGIALEAASGDGSVVEWLPLVNRADT